LRRQLGICAPFVVALLLAGCASSQPSFYATQLDTSGGLGPGDPITHASATIGHVTGVSPISGTDS
jgi:ABC-type transporter Mla subunit MlaD